jgi:4-amino-4-deoxy-L-arabinose transferase-like glycosyltransferase
MPSRPDLLRATSAQVRWPAMTPSQELLDSPNPPAQEVDRSILAKLRAVEPRSIALPAAIVTLAAVLRLWAIKHDAQNPFYDAAVRSMSLSWHNFFFGALDPSGKLGIDKPPVDLWLQVATTKLLGFNRTALALPETLGGIAAVGLLYAAIARACGRLAGSLAALALAVLPIAVLTSRSDTMDSVMSALLIAALWSAIVAVQTRRARWVLLSVALVGVAFDVKLAQALVPLPALALLWWASRSRRRLALAVASAAVLVVVAMAWAFTASLTPLSGRPFPMGSHTGSIYRAMFIFDGLERLTGASHELTPYGFSSPPGFGRLLSSGQPHYATLVGAELVVAFALLIATVVVWLLDRERHPSVSARTPAHVAPEPPRVTPEQSASRARARRWLIAALCVWLTTGYLLFSFMGHLQPRYLEAMSPALAALLGIASAHLLTRAATAPRVRIALVAALSLGLLAGPAEASVDLVEERTSDANPSGSGSQYGAYLRAHRHGARYETAAANPLAVVGLIAQDGQPVLVLRSVDGVLVSVDELRRLVRERALRFVILPHPCSSGRHCTPTTAWSVRNSVRVLPGLYRYVGPSRLH